MPNYEPIEIIPGLYQIRLPVPIRSLGSVFVYLVREEDENLLIDTGWDSEEAYIALRTACSSVGFSIPELQNVVISHLHPDHFGLSARIKQEAPNARIMMHHLDASALRNNLDEYTKFLSELHDWIEIHGAPEKELQAMLDSSLPMVKFVTPAHPDVKLLGGEIIRLGEKWRFQVIPTPGHTAGNLCLHDKGQSRVFFSGDHVLPTITPNVSLTPTYQGDPLGDYLESLYSLREMDTSLILPSHEYVFSDLPKRVDQIQKHHQERLENIMSVTSDSDHDQSAYEVASKLHWYAGSWEKLSAWEKRAAVMETLAHLEYLKRRGRITQIELMENVTRRIHYTAIRS